MKNSSADSDLNFTGTRGLSDHAWFSQAILAPIVTALWGKPVTIDDPIR